MYKVIIVVFIFLIMFSGCATILNNDNLFKASQVRNEYYEMSGLVGFIIGIIMYYNITSLIVYYEKEN